MTKKTSNETKNQEVDITPFVSNEKSNIYAIAGLPEEFIATLFAWVSRSPKSFKEHLREAVKEFDIKAPGVDQFEELTEKAKSFHEKWTVGYGHSCYDEETDVLTRSGFKKWSEVDETDELASVHPETLEIEYQKPVRLIAEPYKGAMYKVDRNRLDMLVTPNHKVFAWPRHKIKDFETRKYQLIEAQDLKDKCYKVKLGGLNWSGDVSDTIYGYPTEPLLKMIGFFIGDGYIDPRAKHSVQFHLRRERKINYLYSLCDDLGLNLSSNKNDKYYITSNSEVSIGSILSKCYNDLGEKVIPSELFNLDSSLLGFLYDGLLNSDGSVGRTGELFDTTSVTLVDQVQHLCTLLGWTTSTTLLHPAGSKGNNVDGWRVFVNKKLLESMVNKVQYDIFDEWVDYDGMVYCAELEKYHTLIVRRNGRIHVSGNSVAEHASIHVGLEEVSRKLSSDLELASDFLSITEYSQRYQKPKRGGWINPFKLKRDREDYQKTMNEIYTIFEKLIKVIFENTKGKRKDEKGNILTNAQCEKLAFEDARYVLPLSMHTQLGVTANARSWREVVAKLRASGTPEQKEVADKLEEEISKVAPTLLRHTKESKYQVSSKESYDISRGEVGRALAGIKQVSSSPLEVALVNAISEKELINQLYSILVATNTLSLKDSISSDEEKREVILELLEDMEFFDHAHDLFKLSKIDFVVNVSEANWHQLLRHNRSMAFEYSAPFAGLKVTPPEIKKIPEALELYEKAFELMEELRVRIKESKSIDESMVEYLYLNGHMRRVSASASIWSLYHLINLRTSEEAQWEIRDVMEKLSQKLLSVYPGLFKNAKRRLK